MYYSLKRFLTLKEFTQLIRYGLVGILGVSTAYLLLHSQITLLKIHPIPANIIATGITSIISFLCHKLWTFKAKQHAKQYLIRFYMVGVSSFALGQIIFISLYKINLSYTLAFFSASIIMPIYNFLMNKFWVFKEN